MARFAPDITPESLRDIALAICTRRLLSSEDWEQQDVDDMTSREPMGIVTHAMVEGLLGKAYKDIAKVDFDLENLYVGAPREDTSWHASLKEFLGFHRTGNLSFLGCLGGGDWQDPVAFVLYHDGKDLRGYVPTDGNSFVLATKKAAEANGGTQPRPFDVPAMISDVGARIQVRA
jgi:hypothetical protein